MTRVKYRRFRPWMLNGRPGNISRACKRFIVRATNAGLVVTSTTGGQHAPGSYHKPRRIGAWIGKGRAVDVAGAPERMRAFQRREYMQRRRRYRELIGPINHANVKNMAPWDLAEGTALEQQHDNHVHGSPRW